MEELEELSEGPLAQRLELYGCFQCGKCTGGCPVSLKSSLNIRKLMIKTILERGLQGNSEKEALWDCTTCKTCTLRCPRGLKPMDLVLSLRESLVEEGRIPKTVMGALGSVQKYANPWGQQRNKRIEWVKELPPGLKVKDFSKGERAEHLYFTGCTGAFDPRIQKSVKSLVLTLSRAGVDFGILGNEEHCCGNEVRRMGETGLFEMLVEENLQRFDKFGIEQIFTPCPHGFNALKNEYPEGKKFQVRHTTQVLAQCLDQGKLPLKNEIKKTVTYHDPCFLGKQNGIFDEPRALLSAIPGITFKELDRSRERSLCCEGGGGRMWVESSSTGTRLAEVRVRDAVELGAEVLVTACPFCTLTLEDAVKTAGLEEKIKIMDLVELLAESIGE